MTDHTTRLLERLAETFPERPAPLPELVAAAHAARRRRTRRQMALAAGSCVLAVAAGVTLQQVLPDDGAQRSDRVADAREACDRQALKTAPSSPVPQGPDFPTNAAGQTYGSGATHRPDLMAVVGDCGRPGYALSEALDDPAPWVPGAGSDEPLVVAVYESDGVTQVDTYTRGAGVPRPSSEPPTGPDAADVQGEWTAIIAGVTDPDGTEQYDTFRDLDLTITFDGEEVRAYDGCRTWAAGLTLTDGQLALTSPFAANTDTQCKRAAPLPQVLVNVGHVTESGKQTYLHLDNFQIVVVLTRAG